MEYALQVAGPYDRLLEAAALGITRFYFQGVFTPSDTERLLDGLGVTP